MEEKYYMSCSPCSDVTALSEYQIAANSILSSIFSLGKSKEVQNAERNIKILKITNHPINYLSAKALYEIRTAQARKVPSPFIQTSSPKLRSATEYNPWEVVCPDLSASFTKQQQETQVPGSDFLSECDSCDAKGYTPCSCGTGVETCYSCGGHGNVTCHSCGGSGELICGSCGGYGQTSYTEYRGGGTEGPVETITVWKQCYNCGGSGRVICGTCGGYGALVCATCDGHGEITCRSCGGTKKITCDDCEGHGYFLHTVHVKQDVNTTNALKLLNDYQVDDTKYINQKFPHFQPSENDSLLYSAVNNIPLDNIPLERILPTQYSEPYAVSQMMTDLTSNQMINSAGAKYIRFLVEVYQRDVLEITYQFQEVTYHLLVDRATGAYLMDENPYGSVAAGLLDKLTEHYQNGELRSFRDVYNEFSIVSNADNIALGEADAKPMMAKIKRKCYIIPAAASIATHLLLSLFIPGWPAWLIVISGLFCAAASILVAHFAHMPLMLDKKNLTYTLLADLGIAISIAVHIIISVLL